MMEKSNKNVILLYMINELSARKYIFEFAKGSISEFPILLGCLNLIKFNANYAIISLIYKKNSVCHE
jgi:hypothetical protein